MSRQVLKITLLALVLPWLGAARLADVLPEPEVGYRALRVMDAAGQRLEQTVHAMPGVERVETPTAQGRAIAIIDRERAQVVSWVEDQPFLIEAALGEDGFDPYGAEFERVQVHAISAEAVAGVPARKFRIIGWSADGEPIGGHVWLTAENIVLRAEGAMIDPERGPVPFTLQLHDLVVGPQPASLFEPPPGLQPAPAMPSLRALMQAARGADAPSAERGGGQPSASDADTIQEQLENARRQIEEMMQRFQPQQ